MEAIKTAWDFFQNEILGMHWLNRLIYTILNACGLDTTGKIGGSIQFFIYDTIKIMVLLGVLILIISYIQSFFPPERTKKILGRFHGIGANIIAALLGTVTPFCSCSSIPLFIGFTSAGLPLGVTFSFLISSPMVDLGSLVLLMSIFGWKVAVVYVVLGLVIAVAGGTLIEKLHLENQVEEYIRNGRSLDVPQEELHFKDRMKYAWEQVVGTAKKVAPYFEATKRFCKFLADNYRLQNFKNVEDRHFKAYVEHLKENNSAATIQSDLSGIRYFHRKSGSKNRLSKNDKLSLPKRATGVKDHSLLDKELVCIRQWAIEKGRQDVVIGFDFASEFGLRLEEICTLRVEYLMSALKTGQLVIKGKGGQTRAIDLSAKQRSIITDNLNYARCSGRYPRDYLISGSEKGGVQREKRSLQNWMSYNRKYFMVENREDFSEDGKKKRTETISWHSLRHTYAQRTYAEALQERPRRARKIVSENLGHHRTEVTRIYLADKPKKK